MEFCQKHQLWNSTDWKNVVFTDETTIRSDPPMEKRVLCKRGEEYKENNTVVRKVAGRESVMFWGSIGGGKKLSFREVPGRENQEMYLSISEENCLENINEVGGIMNVYWMHDNA